MLRVGPPSTALTVMQPRMTEGAGAGLLFLLPHKPDFNSIENAFAKLKALLRKTAECIVDDLRAAIGGRSGSRRQDRLI